MPLPNKRAVKGLVFAENDSREVRLPKGFLERGVVISGEYTDTISADGTAVRAFACPIKSIQLIGDGGDVLHQVRPADLIREMMIYEQSALANILNPPASFLIGARAGTFDIQLMFAEPFAFSDGNATALPSWIYDECTLRIDWGGHAQCIVGGAGVVTMQRLSVTAIGLQDKFEGMGNPFAWGSKLGVALRSYKEYAVLAAADAAYVVEIPRTADIRSILIMTEDANGEPVSTIVDTVTLEIDNSLRQFAEVPGRVLRADAAKIFGVSMPTGVYPLEFAEDKDISEILEARKFTALNLVISKLAVAGTLRVYLKRIRPGRGVAAAA